MTKKTLGTLIAEPIKILMIIGFLMLAWVELGTVQSVSPIVFYTYAAIFTGCILSLVLTFFSKTRIIGYVLFAISVVAYIIMAFNNQEIEKAWEKQACNETSRHWNDEWKTCIGTSAHCPPEHVWNNQTNLCEVEVKTCRANEDCEIGEYCFTYWFQANTATCDSEYENDAEAPRHKGVCRLAAKDRADTPIFSPYIVSTNGMNWSSANRFCQAMKMQLIAMADFECREAKLGIVGGQSEAVCLNKNGNDEPSKSVVLFREMYGSFSVWTADADKTACTSAQVSLSDGMVKRYNQLAQAGLAVCKPVQ